MVKVQLSERAQALKDEFICRRRFWVDEYEELAVLCPDFLEKHIEASAIATRSPVLSPLMSEFIAIAIDAATTHLFVSGLRLHIKAALSSGRPRRSSSKSSRS